MKTQPITSRQLRAAGDAVAEFAMISLRPEYLCWTKDVNFTIAEFTWNLRGHSMGKPLLFDPRLHDMVQRLTRARQGRFAEHVFDIVGLDAHREGNSMVLTFDVTWDEGLTYRPLAIRVGPSAPVLN